MFGGSQVTGWVEAAYGLMAGAGKSQEGGQVDAVHPADPGQPGDTDPPPPTLLTELAHTLSDSGNSAWVSPWHCGARFA